MMTLTPRCSQTSSRSVERQVAQLRRKQLELAMAGRVVESAQYAQQVQKVLQRSC